MEYEKNFCNIFVVDVRREKFPGLASKTTKQKTFD